MNSVWDREGYSHVMSKNLFLFLVCLWVSAGVGTSMAFSAMSASWQVTWPLLIGAFVSGLIGVFLAGLSDNPLLSLIGYGMVAVPFGLLLGPVVALYTTASVVKVLFLTTSMTVILGIVGAVIPDSLEGLGMWLLGGLTILIMGMIIVPVAGFFGVPISGAMTLLDWIGVILFSAYVVYDLNRAMRIERTLDNSIDIALAVYLDWLNLFIRLLSLTGQRRSK